jgi:transketolase|tara:strand:- start:99 stop:1028 length:930 start_codon:yes stop_codon:yes gene_type:complete
MNKIDYRNAFFDEFVKIAKKDKNVILLTADTDADSLKKFKKENPDRFINTGVAEQETINLATGLALSGKKVFIYSLLPFITMRCFEQIKINICSLKLPITIIGLGTGLSFSHYGPAGHGVIDIGLMRMLPEMQILNPSDPVLAGKFANVAYRSKLPVYIRLNKGQDFSFYKKNLDITNGFEEVKKGKNICVITTGNIIKNIVNIQKKLLIKSKHIGVIDLYQINPIKKAKLIKILKNYSKILTIEENIYNSGIGSIIAELILDNDLKIKLKRVALKNEQCFKYGSVEWLHKSYSIDQKSLDKTIYDYSK